MRKITKIETKEKTKEIKVAAYIRVSTKSLEQENSFINQKEHFERLISKNNNWKLVKIYSDQGGSGTSIDKREGLQELIKDSEDKNIDVVVTKSISRLARNTRDCLSIVRKLQELGLALYFEKENINTQSMDGEVMLTILSSLAEDESRSHSKNIKWSIKKRFETGRYIVSTPAFGYKKYKDNMIINEEESKYVEKIYELYLQGMGTWSIEKYLNKKYPNKNREKSWKERTITEILKNINYTGDLLLQKTYTDEDYKTRKNKGERDQYLIENHHPAIISKEKFEKVQKLMQENSEKKGSHLSKEKYKERYEFSGKIKCSSCRKSFKRRHHYNPSYIAWTCSGRIKEKEKCTIKYIKDEEISKLRVAAYCRVSTNTEEQASSYEMQIEHYTNYIKNNPKW